MASGAERFELLLVNEHKVATEVFAALRHLGCESVADFVGLYTEADYEDGLKEVLQHTTNFKTDRIQLARLRVAWARAKQDLSTTSAGSQDENLEAPLPPEVRQRQEDAFFAKYGLRFPPDLLPAATLFARHFREFRRHHKELDDLARVKSSAEASSAPATEVKQLGDFRVVLKAESPAVSFKDLISLLRAHEILLNSLAMAGTAERDSKVLPGTKVCEFSMSDNLAYRTFAAERLRRYPGLCTSDWLEMSMLGRPLIAAFSGLIARQYYEASASLTPALALCIQYLQLALSILPSRIVDIYQNPRPPVIIYTDASTEAPTALGFRLGIWIALDGRILVSSVDVPQAIVDAWAPRRTYINLLELLAVPLLAFSEPEILKDRDVLWFLDNQAAWRAIIRSASSVSDVNHLSLLAGLQFAKLRCNPWFEWVPSHQNLSDPLSRQGWADPEVAAAIQAGTWTPLVLSPPWDLLAPDLESISSFITALE